ncbi:chaperone protein dnaJ C76, chloroplastic-like isoform X2 [Prosopis cineraria]|uniref:chaperone protein dnaJ C76, chloroplastic-like isoform X2 n=1 Tax=Prosopis cineraria TaxID=364024 RepID=UPI00240F0988|nr:chaperone protein dnaJ C76, chloroplastic-like isoform X2 [Prosopis cineraria]
MSVGVVSSCCFLSCSKPFSQVHGYLNFHGSMSRWRQNGTVIRCCNRRAWEKSRAQQNYYELLGISAESNAREIKEAYRKLQKKYHPDIAGQQGHEHTLLLNKAYQVLRSEDERRKYDESIGQMRLRFGEKNSASGCGECAHFASNTFIMDEALGSARVKVQYGDDDQNIEVSVESCPVNCIHWVETEELAVLEFLIQPQPKKGYGVFGGGWERPANVFSAAKAFNKQLERKAAAGYSQSSGETTVEESPAEAQARAQASLEIKMGGLFKLWKWVTETFSTPDP